MVTEPQSPVIMFKYAKSMLRKPFLLSLKPQQHPRVSSGNSEYAQIIDSLDETVDPCDNFYEYACGGWKSTQTVPTGHSKWNTFNIVEMENKAAMKEVRHCYCHNRI